MILLTFGWLAIGSMFILAGWFRHGWRHRHPLSFYNAALCMAVGMDLVSIGFAMQISGRVVQILFTDISLAIENPVYWLGMALMLAGKTFFVWIAALGEGRTYSKPFIWSYWLSLAAWGAFSAWWYL